MEGTTSFLLKTLEFYIEQADLTDIQYKILDMKKDKIHNQDIADFVNFKYGKSYSTNYISTIFRQKIIKAICEAATYHELVISNLYFPENFKKCSGCGRHLLIDSHNFVKKTRSKDGFTNRCKICDRNARKQKKGELQYG